MCGHGRHAVLFRRVTCVGFSFEVAPGAGRVRWLDGAPESCRFQGSRSVTCKAVISGLREKGGAAVPPFTIPEMAALVELFRRRQRRDSAPAERRRLNTANVASPTAATIPSVAKGCMLAGV